MKKYILSFLLLLSSFYVTAQEKGLDQRIDEAFQPISDFFSKYVFYPIGDYPFVIYLLVGSALFFTLYFTLYLSYNSTITFALTYPSQNNIVC